MSGTRRRPAIAEPAVVAHLGREQNVVAIGQSAAQMLGRTPAGLMAEHPFTGGGVRSPGLARALLQNMMQRAPGRGWQRPDLVIAIASTATALERRAYQRLGKDAGAARIEFAALSACRALGLDLPLFTPRGSLIIDVGATRTTVDLMSLGAPVASVAVDGAGVDLDHQIARELRMTYGLMIGEQSARDLKHQLLGVGGSPEAEVHGRDSATGLPRRLSVRRDEFDPLVESFAQRIALKTQELLRGASPELAADLSEDGFWLTGGGAHLRHLRDRLPELLDLPLYVDERPDDSISLGLTRLLDPRVAPRLLREGPRARRN